jgi:hypothetical protein
LIHLICYFRDFLSVFMSSEASVEDSAGNCMGLERIYYSPPKSISSSLIKSNLFVSYECL